MNPWTIELELVRQLAEHDFKRALAACDRGESQLAINITAAAFESCRTAAERVFTIWEMTVRDLHDRGMVAEVVN